MLTDILLNFGTFLFVGVEKLFGSHSIVIIDLQVRSDEGQYDDDDNQY